MTHTFTMPDTIYMVAADFEALGLGNAGDFCKDISAAADQAAGHIDHGKLMARVFKIEFCVKHNTPEAITEVTEQVERIIAERLFKRGATL